MGTKKISRASYPEWLTNFVDEVTDVLGEDGAVRASVGRDEGARGFVFYLHRDFDGWVVRIYTRGYIPMDVVRGKFDEMGSIQEGEGEIFVDGLVGGNEVSVRFDMGEPVFEKLNRWSS